jgi:hypothetical protein
MSLRKPVDSCQIIGKHRRHLSREKAMHPGQKVLKQNQHMVINLPWHTIQKTADYAGLGLKRFAIPETLLPVESSERRPTGGKAVRKWQI